MACTTTAASVRLLNEFCRHTSHVVLHFAVHDDWAWAWDWHGHCTAIFVVRTV